MDTIAPFPVTAPQVSESLTRWPVSLPAQRPRGRGSRASPSDPCAGSLGVCSPLRPKATQKAVPVRWVFPTPGMKKTVEKEAQQLRHWAQWRAGSPGARAQVMLQTVGVVPCLPARQPKTHPAGLLKGTPASACLSARAGGR